MIFFSYARADSKFVLTLAERMREAGIDLWVDQLNIPSGARWDQAVEEALKSSSGLVAVLSPSSIASQNVMDEVSYAIDQQKNVIPVLVSNCELPLRLRRLQYIDFTTNFDTAFEQLCSALKRAQPGANPSRTPPSARPVNAFSKSRSLTSAKNLLISAMVVGLLGTLALLLRDSEKAVSGGNYQNCIAGYVWRLATPEDRVCVTMETHLQTLRDNQAANSRRAIGRYGPDTCVQGYVWREAFPGDRACVTPEVRAQAASDNEQAAQRVAR